MKRYRMKSETRYISTAAGKMKLVVLRPYGLNGPLPGILWIHGGGYALGAAGMVRFSAGKMLASRFGAVVVSPEYRLAGQAPYPAALEDCSAAFRHMFDNAEGLGIRRDMISVGGESAGGGLAAALCIYERDRGGPAPRLQLPLYPMLDCEDTETSRDNHGRIWNTKRNHWGWSKYLGELYGSGSVPKYASPSRETDYSGLPPCYTYVCDGEPFRAETLAYVDNLKKAGVNAKADIFRGNVHAFDRLCFWTKDARDAKRALIRAYETAMAGEECGTPQN